MFAKAPIATGVARIWSFWGYRKFKYLHEVASSNINNGADILFQNL